MTRNLYLVAAIFISACAPTTAANTPAPTTTSTAPTTTTTVPTTTATTSPPVVVSPPRARTSPRAGRGVAASEGMPGQEVTLAAIAECESGGNPRAVSASGRYTGKHQFDDRTWASMGGTGRAADAPEAEQDARAAELYRQRGAQPWPTCGRRR